ncbi:hypothetical protein L3Q82_016055 [Scortum barcoo]|uniref:Uncharacterized protein n=1 Tax=Scortum barcoo TaxID=214431 RepID=A0ACB8VQ38_9TELE|nr:hypothetical protein L3Q82_016055 [Scortum barcoo]
MQDNARPHVAGVCQQFLQDEGIDAMDWPARSPDLNPIEHIWDIMSRSIHQRHVAPQTVQELADALVQKPPCPPGGVRCFSNNKPWVTPDLRALLLEKRRAFQSGDRDELRRVQRDLKWKIKECKASYRRKMEDHLQQNNAREVWRGLQAISGQGKNERRNPEPGDRDWANKLNLFFNRFDTWAHLHPPQPEHRPAHLQLPLPARPLTTINTSTISGALTHSPHLTLLIPLG